MQKVRKNANSKEKLILDCHCVKTTVTQQPHAKNQNDRLLVFLKTKKLSGRFPRFGVDFGLRKYKLAIENALS